MLGAAVGAGGAIGAAAIAGRKQAGAQHRQWQREVRREAYREFIANAYEHEEVLLEILKVGHNADAGMSALQRLGLVRDSGRRALASLALEAPGAVADHGRLLIRTREEYATALGYWVVTGNPLTSETGHKGQKARDCLNDFIRVASETLDR